MTLPMPRADSTLPVPTAAPPPAAERESFVINLCSSTTPMALTQPQLVELKQYKFFVSRRLEDGRERFRLHMGYFDSLLQAEEVLPVVREIYPGAWAGEAPGKRLRAKAAATPVAPLAAATPAPLAAGPSAEILARTPTLAAAPEPTPAAAPVFALELMATPPRAPMVELASEAAAPAAVVVAPPPAPAAAAAPVTPARTAPRTAPRAGSAKRDAAPPFDLRSNVREVLKSLDESAGKAPPPAAPAAPAAPAVPVAKAAPAVPRGPAARQPGVLPESQVLHLLEEKRGDPLNTTSTPAAFSVQLQWSVQPIDLARVPPLAIFGAYTLYTVEGSREGRRWFGLRLGFFSDANSAKQVAQYVRSEFSAVAVVPVSLKERDGASGASGSAPPPQRPTERLPTHTGEFKLLDDTGNTPKPAAPAPAAKAPAAKPKASAPPAAAGNAAGGGRPAYSGRVPGKTARSRANRVQAHEKRAPQTLEETLEILGADQLQIEGAATKKLVSEGAIRHLDMKVQKNSAFSRLLDRLSERSR
jgi:hypothetical protein